MATVALCRKVLVLNEGPAIHNLLRFLKEFDRESMVTANGELRFDRGCGYAWQWHGQPMRIRRPTAAKPVVEAAPPRRVAGLAVDADGRIWLSDGACADPDTFNRVWRSADEGRHWTALPVKRVGTSEDIARQILAFMTIGFATGSIVFLDGGGSIV